MSSDLLERSRRMGGSRAIAPLLMVLVLLVTADPAHSTPLGCVDDASATSDRPSWAAEILATTNAHRATLGLPQLQLDPGLGRGAVWKARDMARRDYFTHADPIDTGGTRSPWERLTDCGFTTAGASSQAENIAAGRESGAAFTTGWLNSTGHRRNIENASMRYIGIAVAFNRASTNGTYAVQMFSSSPSIEPVLEDPPTPAVDAITFPFNGPAQSLCPPAADAAWGATIFTAESAARLMVLPGERGCIDVAPIRNYGGFTAQLSVQAWSLFGRSSPMATVAVQVAPAPGGDGTTGGDPAREDAVLRGTTASIERVRCRGQHATRRRCLSLVVTSRLTSIDGRPVIGARVVVRRVRSAGAPVRVARAVTDARGMVHVVAPTGAPGRGTARWLARNYRAAIISFAGSESHRSTEARVAI